MPVGCVDDKPYGTVLHSHFHARPGPGEAVSPLTLFGSHGFFLFRTIVVDQASPPCRSAGSAQWISASCSPAS
jgi:hypothetical protein